MNKNGWKYSKKRLAKHEFCAAIINPKKVICICGKIIKHVNGNGCKRKIGQRSIYCFFNNTISNENEEISSEEEYDSDICDSMNNDNIITVDSEEDDIYNNSNDILSSEDEDQPIIGGARRIEVIGKELQIYTEAEWKIDREGFCVRGKNCNVNRVRVTKPDEKNLKFTPNWYFENDKLKKYLKNGLKEAFNNLDTFKGLCNIICQVIDRKEKGKGTQNLQYSEEFTSFLVILGTISPRALDLFRQNLVGRSIQSIRQLRMNSNDMLTNPDLCFENVARFKRFLDKINYKGPIAAMSDNTKLKPSLRYSSQLGCIIGSTLSQEETKINAYSDIPKVIQLIKDKNGIANYVRVYILQVPLPKFPPVIIALIPNNGRDSADIIANLHKKLLLEIASQLNISIISIGSDGAAAEFKAQSIIMNMQTINKIEIIDSTLNINFSCPILSNIGPVIRIQDPKHAKKTARNIIMSGARVLTFGKHIANFKHFLNLVNSPTSVLYKNDVIKLDRQDDRAAYRSFCYHNLAQCLNKNEIKKGYESFFIYLFVLGELVDSYLNREICPVERIRMFLLVKSHREYYPEFPLLPWMHGSEACEHVFGIARQIRTDFDFAELLQMISKISHYSKSIRTSNLLDEKEKSVREGII
ncbi:hypothetical protein Glove_393g19 [Diversispora epigaea]|uniref:Uncharacterized protein n=1 Tax=Diversispora epigaea TaxID=1348612 RepID=A0A397H9N6_9GLOM|nr:hypothetical protein Glove_393g19 [Diversispora epigaea]